MEAGGGRGGRHDSPRSEPNPGASVAAGFESGPEIPGPMEHAQDLDAVSERAVEDDVVPESLDRPNANAGKFSVRRSPSASHQWKLGEGLKRRLGGIQEPLSGVGVLLPHEDEVVEHVLPGEGSPDDPPAHLL